MNNTLKLYLLTLSFLAFTASCDSQERIIEGSSEFRKNITYSIAASVETQAVSQQTYIDAADDPAFWRHPSLPEKSVVIGTDKVSGLAVYDLNGKLLHFYENGATNNVDVRYDFIAGKDTFDIVAASDKTNNTIDLYKINPTDASLTPVNDNDIFSSLYEVYGFCLYKSQVTGKFYAFVNTKTGEVEQWLLTPTAKGTIHGSKVREFTKESFVEGMVADDVNGWLFLGGEISGIWRYNAEPDTDETPLFIEQSDSTNPNIKYDIEGLAIYNTSNTSGYLIASSQGNFSYAVFNRMPPHNYIGSFFIKDGIVDGVEETDGIELVNGYINEHFPEGMLIVQDGINKDSTELKPQNFKYIDWRKIKSLLQNF
jgi:3-phytase